MFPALGTNGLQHEKSELYLIRVSTEVVETEGIPDGCVLSVRAGATRRQATHFGLFLVCG